MESLPLVRKLCELMRVSDERYRLVISEIRANNLQDHCIEILRLNIQCNADIGLFTFHMVPGDPLA